MQDEPDIPAPSIAASHIGLCVSDLERSMRFYCDGLGFIAGEAYTVGDEVAACLEVPSPARVTSQLIRRDGLTIELLGFESPSTVGRPSSARNHLGFTHLSMRVDDVERVAARLVELGGTVLEPTRTVIPLGADASLTLLFLTDPDGTRVELMS